MPPYKNVTPQPGFPALRGLGLIGLGFVVIIGLWAFFSCFTQVPADSVGVLLRLGRYAGNVQPGLRWKFPLGIDRLVLVPVQRQLKLEFGFETPGASRDENFVRDPKLEESMVTGDLNMALVRFVVQYRVADPKEWLFNVRDPAAILRDISEASMREIVGDRTVDEVLTIGRQDVEDQTLVRLQQLSRAYGLGVNIKQVQLKDVHPPGPVQASFNEVNQAQQEREQAINMANGEYNKAVPRSRGLAEQAVSQAEGYAVRRINEARGDADRFKTQFAAYLKAPEVTRQRLYLETMGEVFPQIQRKIILDDRAGGLLPFLPLNLQSAAPAPATVNPSRR